MAHIRKILVDFTLYDLKADDYDILVLLGGQVGFSNMSPNLKMREIIKQFNQKGKFIAAICAAPIALEASSVLDAKFTCYPSCEVVIQNVNYVSDKNIVIDTNFITSRGPATAMEFALAIVLKLAGEAKFHSLKRDLLFEAKI
ncbi:MAG: DJ-1 family glyoxalase III [Campylobacter sp.]